MFLSYDCWRAIFLESEPGVSAPCVPPPVEATSHTEFEETNLQAGTKAIDKRRMVAQHSCSATSGPDETP